MGKSATSVRFAVVGDIHVHKDSAGSLRGFFSSASEAADALLLCGDLTDYGTAEEAQVLADELAGVTVPIVAVLGNHDYESGTPQVVIDALARVGAKVLDGEAVEIEGVGIAGVKGFAGGFGRGSLGAWGEPAIKAFVQRLLHESLDGGLAPGAQRTPAEAAGEALDAGDAHALDLARLAIEHAHPGLGERLAHDLRRAGFVVVVAQDGHHRHLHQRELVGEHVRLFGGAVVGEVPAQQQHVGRLGRLGEEGAQAPRGILGDVEVADGGETNSAGGWGHGVLPDETSTILP